MPENRFTFEISLSVLDHLGRNLYRSFATVLGEAISNAWDADAENVHIYIDRENNNFFIKDDGIGMTAEDFQNKFLKIGYSKRKEGSAPSHQVGDERDAHDHDKHLNDDDADQEHRAVEQRFGARGCRRLAGARLDRRGLDDLGGRLAC